jgi:acyl-CoA dehydrogenase
MTLDFSRNEDFAEIREGVRRLCAGFPGEYWRKLDERRAYPTEFVRALTEAGYLSVLIPEEYGGSGLSLSAAAAVLDTIQAEGCNGGACHAQMYTMAPSCGTAPRSKSASTCPKSPPEN